MRKILFLLLSFASISIHAQNYRLFIGTYTNKGTSEGIYLYNFNTQNATVQILDSAKAENPSYLALSNDNKFLYSVNEAGKNSGVSSYKFDYKLRKLKFVDKKPTQGADPCYIAVKSNHIFLANYSGGNIEVFYTSPSGQFLKPKQLIQHTGKGVDLKRQLSAHVHQVILSPDKKYLVSTDLGEDKVYTYSFAPTHARELQPQSIFETEAGTGPRHLAFSPNGRFAYLAHEFNGKITVLNFDKGKFSKIQEMTTTAADFKGNIDGADIHLSADGKFLYETNRGDANTISVFAVATNGTLKHVETLSTQGRGPRNFVIDPTGSYLLVAHQYTNEVVIFKRDHASGKLTDTGKRIKVGVPVCLIFAQ